MLAVLYPVEIELPSIPRGLLPFNNQNCLVQ